MNQDKLVKEVVYEICIYTYPALQVLINEYDNTPAFYDDFRLSEMDINNIKNRCFIDQDTLYKVGCVVKASLKKSNSCSVLLTYFYAHFLTKVEERNGFVDTLYGNKNLKNCYYTMASSVGENSLNKQLSAYHGYSAIFFTDYLMKDEKGYKPFEKSIPLKQEILGFIKELAEYKKEFLRECEKMPDNKVLVASQKYSQPFYKEVISDFQNRNIHRDVLFLSGTIPKSKSFSGSLYMNMITESGTVDEKTSKIQELVDCNKEIRRKAIVNALGIYLDLEIDIAVQIFLSELTSKDIRNIVNRGFLLSGKGNIEQLSDKDKQKIYEACLSVWFLQTLSLDRKQAIAKCCQKEKASSNKVIEKHAKELKEENVQLKERLLNSDNEREKAVREYKDKIKLLESEVYNLRKENEKLEEKIEDLYYKEIPEEEKVEEVKESSVDIEGYLRENLGSHKILVWGLRDKHMQIIKDKFPEFQFIDSDKDIQGKELEGVEGAIIYTGYTCHAKFFTARDLFKARNIPVRYIGKEKTNEKFVYEAAYRILMSI
ncbi:MAG: hypothetical protein IK121_06940 [Lachnospiraceae bacterium]|nr:hypothetical protein [Lachnospiraceae bacterium]